MLNNSHFINQDHTHTTVQTPTSSYSTLVELLQWRAAHKADERLYTFLVNGETESAYLTCAELEHQAKAIAARLQEMELTGERALLLHPPGLDFIAAFFGCLYAGVIAVPMFPPRLNRPDPRLQAILQDAKPGVMLTDAATLSKMERRLAHMPELRALPWLATDVVTQGSDADRLASHWQQPTIDGESLAFLQYTSGSTAMPKGVMVSHRNLLHNSELIHQWYANTPHTSGVSWTPMYHDMGLVGGVIQPLYSDFPIVLMSPIAFLEKPLRWLQAISTYRATISAGPNFAYELCIRKSTPEQRESLDLSSWEVAISGAEPVRAETLTNFVDAFITCGFRAETFAPCYGLAESTVYVSGGVKSESPVLCTIDSKSFQQNQIVTVPPEHKDAQTIVGCGQERLGQKMLVVDPNSFIHCPPNQVGEIWLSGPSITQGYWNRPEQTEQSFRAYLNDSNDSEERQPYLRTGDLGFIRNGELFVTGRLKDLLIIRGRNHYPQDIEHTVVRSHPALESDGGAAFTVLIEGEERLVIVQEVKRTHLRSLNQDGISGEIIDRISQAVAEQHELQTYAVLLLKPMTIPKTSSGKIQRNGCRVAFQEETLKVVAAGGLYQLRDEQLPHQKSDTPHALIDNLNGKTESKDRKPMRNGMIETELQSLQPEMFMTSLTNADIEERRRRLHLYIQEQVATALEISPGQIDITKPLTSLGVDSLTAVDLRNRVMSELSVDVPLEKLIEGPSIEQLADYLLGQIALASIMEEKAPNDELDDELEEIIL